MTKVNLKQKKSEPRTILAADIPYGLFWGEIDNDLYEDHRLFIKTKTSKDNNFDMKDIIIAIDTPEKFLSDPGWNPPPVWSVNPLSVYPLRIYNYQEIDVLDITVSVK